MRPLTISPRPGVSFQILVPSAPEQAVVALQRGEYPLSLRTLFAALEASVAPPAGVLDLGGYLGGFGLVRAAAAAGYEVAIVEASSANVDWIRRSLGVNTFRFPPTVLQAAVGSNGGSVSFCAKGPHGHIETVGSTDVSTETVRQLSISDVLE